MTVQSESGSPPTRSECIDHGCKGFGMGYATAWVVLDGKRFTTTKHRKVHFEATGEWPAVVRHVCDNPRCVNPAHLVGGTYKDNMKDMHDRGRAGDCRNFGLANGMTVLTDAEVEEIRATYVKGSREAGLPALSRKFRVGTSQIWRIVNDQQRTT